MMRCLRLFMRGLLMVAVWQQEIEGQTLPPESFICVEADTGTVLAEQNADERRPPASMIKLIMLLMVAEGIDNGVWPAEKLIPVSEKAQHMGGTQVYLEAGEQWPLEHLMNAVAVASANDAAMAVAEGLWGSEEVYREAMNRRAAELGMTNTRFFSVHGLPPDKGEEFDQTTARDMAILARACAGHARLMSWVRQKEFQFRPAQAIEYNTNKMLWRMEECDGMKTGFIRAAGYCVTATAKRQDTRLIVVIMGSPSSKGRFELAKTLLERGFEQVQRVRVAEADKPVSKPVPVAHGTTPEVRLHARNDVWVTIRPEQKDALRLVFDSPNRLEPPITPGTDVGEMWVELDGKTLAATTLYVADNVGLDLWDALTSGTAPGQN